VKNSRILTRLIEQISQSSGRIIKLIGNPGTGKSWLLTYLAKLKMTIKPIIYYCFTSPIDNEYSIRVTSQQLINNIIDQIGKDCPTVTADSEGPRFASTESRLMDLLSRLGEHGKKMDSVIPITIDGLDHVSRATPISMLNENSKNIIEFLSNINIPDGVCLIIGTQPNLYKDVDTEKSTIELTGFNKPETKVYLSRFFGKRNIVDTDKAYNKTKGLPLLLSSVIKISKTIEEFNWNIDNLPEIDGEIKEYYSWLWKTYEIDNLTVLLAQILSLLAFSVTKSFIMEMPMFKMFESHKIENSLMLLKPILNENGQEFEIFHESFKRFVLEPQRYGKPLINKHNLEVFRHLKNILYSDHKYYNSILRYAILSEQFDEINSLISLDFVLKSIENFIPYRFINQNLQSALIISLKQMNISRVIELSLLIKYTKDGYNNFENIEFLIQISLEMDRKRAKPLLGEEYLKNYNDKTLARLLSLSIQYKLKIPYKKIFDLRLKKYSQSNDKPNMSSFIWKDPYRLYSYFELNTSHDSTFTFLIDYLIIYRKVYGLERCFEILEKLENEEYIVIYKHLSKYCSVKEIEDLKKNIESERKELFLCRNYIQNGNKQKARYIAERRISTNPLLWLDNALLSQMDSNRLEAYLNKSFFIDPEVKDSKNTFFNLTDYSRLAFYCNNLQSIENLVSFAERQQGSYKDFCSLAILTGKINADALKYKIIQEDLNNLLKKLFLFLTNSDHQYHDLDHASLIRIIVKNTLECYFSYTSLIDYSMIFGLERIRLFGMPNTLEVLITLLDCHSKPDIDLIKSFVDSNICKYLRSESLVEILLQISYIYKRIGSINESQKFYNLSIRSLFSYGTHKDFFLLEVLAISTFLVTSNRETLERHMNLLNVSSHLEYATDNDETDIIPYEILGEIIKVDENIGGQIVIELVNNSADKSSYDCLKAVEKLIIHSSANCLLKEQLVNLLPVKEASFNDLNWNINIRLDMVEEAIKRKDESAFTLLENIRFYLEKSAILNKSHKAKFDRLSKKIKVLSLDRIPTNQLSYNRKSIFLFNDMTHLLETISKIDNIHSYQNEFDYNESIKHFLRNNVSRIQVNEELVRQLTTKGVDLDPSIALKIARKSNLDNYTISEFLEHL
jgi:hypothetical protein